MPVLVITGVLLVAACTPRSGSDGSVTLHDVRVAESVNGKTMAVYARIVNGGGDDTLDGLRPGFDAVGSLHEMRHDDGVMTMSPVERIELPAGGTVELRPGSFHGMLAEMSSIPAVGDTVALTFVFGSGVEVEARAPVLPFSDIAGR
jgi:copper(I)-binding protein